MGQLFVWKRRKSRVKSRVKSRGTKEEPLCCLILTLIFEQSKWDLVYYSFLVWIFQICKQKLFIFFQFSVYNLFIFFFIWEWISRLLIELQSPSKNENNPHSLIIWGGDTFQSSIYHSFALKPGCVNKICSIEMLIKPSIFLWSS